MKLALFIQIEEAIMWTVISGAIAAARQQKAELIVYAGPSESWHNQLTPETIETCYNFRHKEHQGLILAFAGDKLLRHSQVLWGEGFPTMLIGRRAGAVPFTSNNNQDAMRQSVRMMVERGHQAIAFLAGPMTKMSSAERQAGYMQGLAQNGLNFDPSLVIQGDNTEKTGQEAVAAALSTGLKFTALIASNDLGAIGAIRALREAGHSVGDDVEVLGFDNIPQSHWSTPPLSTYDPHYFQMGHRACTELACCVSKRNYIVSAIVPAAYIPRSSTWESEVDNEMEHPLQGDWNENKFIYESQLGLLKAEPETAEQLAGLKGLVNSPESFLQSFRELLSEAGKRGLSAGCLYPVLADALRAAGGKAGAPPAVAALIRDACALQTGMLFDEQRRIKETAIRYSMASFELRQLSLSDAKEEAVVACLGRTLSALAVERAGVFLYDQPAPMNCGQAGAGTWHCWAPGAGGDPIRGRRADRFTHDLMPPGSAALVYLPLLKNDELVGAIVLDACNEFLLHYADLVRLFSTAMRAARLRRDLARANAELVETSRMAGLAEMATGVLHNIGNALNGVNTNCSLMAERLRKSRSPAVSRVAELLRKNQDNLAAYLSTDPKGVQVVPYLTQLGEQLEAEQRNIESDLLELRGMVEHINEIVAAQQSYAQISGVTEDVQPSELLEFALRLGEASLTRHNIEVVRHYEDVSDVRIQRQKVVQILVNLVRNAKESMDLARCSPKLLTLVVRPGDPGRVVIEVRDAGMGIAPESLARIFSFGFTTKPGGHGFGLHNSALAAREMGGSLTARSEGLGKGASFVLELPSTSRA